MSTSVENSVSPEFAANLERWVDEHCNGEEFEANIVVLHKQSFESMTPNEQAFFEEEDELPFGRDEDFDECGCDTCGICGHKLCECMCEDYEDGPDDDPDLDGFDDDYEGGDNFDPYSGCEIYPYDEEGGDG